LEVNIIRINFFLQPTRYIWTSATCRNSSRVMDLEIHPPTKPLEPSQSPLCSCTTCTVQGVSTRPNDFLGGSVSIFSRFALDVYGGEGHGTHAHEPLDIAGCWAHAKGRRRLLSTAPSRPSYLGLSSAHLPRTVFPSIRRWAERQPK
jgi:hypothetical protein